MAMNKTLYDFLSEDPTLFSGLTVPSGLVANTVIEVIKDRTGMLYTWIQNAARLKSEITLWSTYRSPDWAKALAALTAIYNPIHNYDREELGSEEIAKHHGTKRSTNEHIEETPGVTTTNTGSVMAYNASAESETGKSVQGFTGKNTREATAAQNYETLTDVDANTYDKDIHTFVNRVTRGNIGITKSQDMVRDEVNLRMQLAIYELIAGEFESKFSIQCY